MRSERACATVFAEHGRFIVGRAGAVDASGGSGRVEVESLPEGYALLEIDDDSQLCIPTLAEGEVEVCAVVLDAPASANADWSEVVELNVTASDGLAVVSSFDGLVVVPIVNLPGEYRMRVSSRAGIEEDYWDDPNVDGPLQHFLIEVWPASMAPVAPLVTGATGQAGLHAELVPLAAAVVLDRREGLHGRAAAERIGARIDAFVAAGPAAMPLGGTLGTANVEIELEATRRKLFSPMKLLWWFTESSHGVGDLDAEDDSTNVSITAGRAGNPYRDPLLGSTDGCSILARRLAFQRPAWITFEWDWYADRQQLRRLLRRPTPVHVTLDQRKRQGTTTTLVRVEHHNLPTAWVDDMTRVWLWKLEDLELRLS